MKKLAYSMAVILAACSCAKDVTLEKTVAPVKGTMTFNANFDDDETRTSLDSDNKIVWDEGDAITVFSIDGDRSSSAEFKLTDGAGTTSATFSGNGTTSSKGYFAVYPASNGMKYSCDKSTVSRNPKGVLEIKNANYSTQYARLGSIPSNIPMVAYAEAPTDDASMVSLDFKNVFAFIKFKISYKCKSVTIEPNNSQESLTSKNFSLSLDDNGCPQVTSPLTSTKTVTLSNENGGILVPGYYYYVAVLPQTLEDGFTMTFTSCTDETKTVTISTDKSVELKRSTVLKLGEINTDDLMGFNGAGTEDDPYLISDFTDLKTLSSLVYQNKDSYPYAYYKQTCDIFCKGQCLDPIGGKTRFSGHYDGNEKTIYDLKVGENDFDDLISFGMFGCIKNAEIGNLTLSNPTFAQISATVAFNISPLVGVAISEKGKNVIHDCHIICPEGSLVELSNFNYLDYGGIVAFNESELEIRHCTSELNIFVDASVQNDSDHLYLGGILGYTSGEKTSDPTHDKASNDANTIVKYCRCTGNIRADNVHNNKTSIGGIVGMCHDSSSGDVCCQIEMCVSSGRLDAWKLEPVRDEKKQPFVGGIIGSMDSDGYTSGLTEYNPAIYCCLVRSTFGSDSNAYDYLDLGGLAGYIYDHDSQISYCVIDEINETHTADDFGYPTFGGNAFAYMVENFWQLKSLKPVHCYTTNEDWYFIEEDYIKYKQDITAEYMNNLMGKEYWTGNASDHSLDIVM